MICPNSENDEKKLKGECTFALQPQIGTWKGAVNGQMYYFFFLCRNGESNEKPC